MPVIATLDDALKQIGIANARSFKIVKGAKDSSNTIYPYNDELTMEDNIEQAKRTMETEVGNLYTLLTYKVNGSRSTSQKSFTMAGNAENFDIGTSAAPSSPVTNQEAMQRIIDAAVDKVRCEYDRRDIERQREELRQEMADFRQKEESFWGVMVQKFAPAIEGYLGSAGRRQLAVAGMPEETARPAAQPAAPAVEAAPAADAPVSIGDTAGDDADTELEDLLTRWAAADAEWRTLLKKVVLLAERQDPMYGMAKDLLKNKPMEEEYV